jgi:hypothetical protein
MKSHTVYGIVTLLVFICSFSALAIMYFALQTSNPLPIILALNFVYLPLYGYIIYRLVKLADHLSYKEFCAEHNL